MAKIRRNAGYLTGHRSRFPKVLTTGMWLVLAFILVGSVFYLSVPEFKRRIDYIPIRVYMLLLEQRRQHRPLTLPTPVPSASVTFASLVDLTPTPSPGVSPTDTVSARTRTPTRSPSKTTVTSSLSTIAPALTSSSTVAPTATPTPTPTLTPTSTATPTPTSTPTATPTPAHTVLQLSGVRHTWQGWNNCAPANLAQVLDYYGYGDTQYDIQKVVKPNKWDMNVSPHELAAYARALGLEVLIREGGEIGMVKRFLDHGIPVILEIWCYPDEHGGGHYRTVVGYDETNQEFIASDTQFGKDHRISYAAQYPEWLAFNWLYILVYRPEQRDLVRSIVGEEMDDTVMYRRALAMALAEVKANPDDPFAWYTVGTNYTAMAKYAEAAVAYDRARVLGVPFRLLWYQFGPFIAYLNLERYQDVIDLATVNLEMVGNQEESHYYLGRAQQALGNLDAARSSYEQALKFNPGFTPAIEALSELERENG